MVDTAVTRHPRSSQHCWRKLLLLLHLATCQTRSLLWAEVSFISSLDLIKKKKIRWLSSVLPSEAVFVYIWKNVEKEWETC